MSSSSGSSVRLKLRSRRKYGGAILVRVGSVLMLEAASPVSGIQPVLAQDDAQANQLPAVLVTQGNRGRRDGVFFEAHPLNRKAGPFSDACRGEPVRLADIAFGQGSGGGGLALGSAPAFRGARLDASRDSGLGRARGRVAGHLLFRARRSDPQRLSGPRFLAENHGLNHSDVSRVADPLRVGARGVREEALPGDLTGDLPAGDVHRLPRREDAFRGAEGRRTIRVHDVSAVVKGVFSGARTVNDDGKLEVPAFGRAEPCRQERAQDPGQETYASCHRYLLAPGTPERPIGSRPCSRRTSSGRGGRPGSARWRFSRRSPGPPKTLGSSL